MKKKLACDGVAGNIKGKEFQPKNFLAMEFTARMLYCSPFYGRACRWAMLGELKPKGPIGLSPIKIMLCSKLHRQKALN